MIIFGTILYFVIGYGMYRLTCLLHPPERGINGTQDYTTWQGSPLPLVLSTCLTVWPIVAAVEIVHFNNQFIRRFLQKQAKDTMIKKVPIIEPFLEEGVREMEKCLTENTE